MSKSLDFYFDFSSPYGYLASTRIEAIAAQHGRTVTWHPILIGAIFKVTGQAPLTSYPVKGEYAVHDFKRSAREHGIPYNHPDQFPISTVAAARACCWISNSSDAAVNTHLAAFIHKLYGGYFADGRNIGEPKNVLAIAEELGLDRNAMAEGLADQAIKDALKASVDEAIQAGIFGSPTMVIDGEIFWGSDRLEQIDRWMSQGGW